MRRVMIFGIVILCEELALLTWWIIGGVCVWATSFASHTGMRYTELHVVGGLHFATTIAVCLALEYYRDLSREHRSKKNRDAESSKTIPGKTPVYLRVFNGGALAEGHESVVHELRPAYMISWLVSTVVAFGTDLFTLLALSVEWNHDIAYIIEMVTACWATTGTILALVWSVWLFVKTRRIHRKLSSE